MIQKPTAWTDVDHLECASMSFFRLFVLSQKSHFRSGYEVYYHAQHMKKMATIFFGKLFCLVVLYHKECPRKYSRPDIWQSSIWYTGFAGTIASLTKRLIFQILFFFIISCKILCKNSFNFFFQFFYHYKNKHKEFWVP